MRGKRATSQRSSAVASSDAIDGMLQGGAAGQRDSGVVGLSDSLSTGVLLLPICPAAPLPTPQLQLGFLLQ